MCAYRFSSPPHSARIGRRTSSPHPPREPPPAMGVQVHVAVLTEKRWPATPTTPRDRPPSLPLNSRRDTFRPPPPPQPERVLYRGDVLRRGGAFRSAHAPGTCSMSHLERTPRYLWFVNTSQNAEAPVSFFTTFNTVSHVTQLELRVVI